MHCKKPTLDHWQRKIKLFPARESLVSDIPSEDEKIANLFLQCDIVLNVEVVALYPAFFRYHGFAA